MAYNKTKQERETKLHQQQQHQQQQQQQEQQQQQTQQGQQHQHAISNSDKHHTVEHEDTGGESKAKWDSRVDIIKIEHERTTRDGLGYFHKVADLKCLRP